MRPMLVITAAFRLGDISAGDPVLVGAGAVVFGEAVRVISLHNQQFGGQPKSSEQAKTRAEYGPK